MSIPSELKYSASHEWVLDKGDGTVIIGITEFAQQQLGDVVFVELPQVDAKLCNGDEFGVIESVKAAADLFVPIAGVVIDVNTQLEDEPELVNTDPHGKGWICKLRLNDIDDLQQLLDADAYTSLCET
jgi:glycine cleavage system H protein